MQYQHIIKICGYLHYNNHVRLPARLSRAKQPPFATMRYDDAACWGQPIAVHGQGHTRERHKPLHVQCRGGVAIVLTDRRKPGRRNGMLWNHKKHYMITTITFILSQFSFYTRVVLQWNSWQWLVRSLYPETSSLTLTVPGHY